MSAFSVTGGGDDQVLRVVESTIQSFDPRVQAALRGIIRHLGTTSASFSSEAALSDSTLPSLS